jgi:hypothetical protein
MKWGAFIAAAALLAGCATAVGTAYQPADKKGFGFTEQKVESDRYRVTFAGDGATPASVVEDYALLRAAEIALANGYDWFRVVGRSLDEEERGGVGVGAGVGGGSFGGRSGVSVGGGGVRGTIGGRRFYTSRLEALMGKGPKPEGGDVYSARDLVDAVRSRMKQGSST